jgi:hypothetical protein
MNRLRHHKFLLLLSLQLIFIFIYPMVETTFWEWFSHVVLMFVYLIVSFLATRNRYHQIILWIFFLVISIIYLLDYLNYFTDIHPLINLTCFGWVYQIGLTLYFLYITFFLSYHMLTDDEPEWDILAGAAAIYLTIAFIWTFFYMTLEQALPGAFKLVGLKSNIGYIDWLFYSIKTLVSSDSQIIIPANSYAQCITILESVIGALYAAIITARIVGVDFNDPRKILRR